MPVPVMSRMIPLLVALAALVAPSVATAQETWTVDPSHSSVLFRIKHMNVSWFFGRFIDFSGRIAYEPADPVKSSIEVIVKADSVRTWSKDRDDHLRSPDFFDVKQFPEISFRSNKVESLEGGRVLVTGDFTLHGVTREIRFEAENTGEGTGMKGERRIGFYAEFGIRRSDYGMTTYVAEGALGDDVLLILSFEAIKE